MWKSAQATFSTVLVRLSGGHAPCIKWGDHRRTLNSLGGNAKKGGGPFRYFPSDMLRQAVLGDGKGRRRGCFGESTAQERDFPFDLPGAGKRPVAVSAFDAVAGPLAQCRPASRRVQWKIIP